MERLIAKKRMTAAAFLLFLFIFAGFNLYTQRIYLRDNIAAAIEEGSTLSGLITEIEDTVDENILGRYYFIDAYGFFQKLLDKKEENNFEVVKDKQGKLHYTYFTETANDTSAFSKRVVNLRNAVSESGSQVIYVMPLDKYIDGYTEYSIGIPYSMVNETADQFLEELSDNGVDSIDLRDYIGDSGLDMSEVFYTTDHHWKIETAYWAANTFFSVLQSDYGEVIENEELYADKDNYNIITYKNCFLGSQGRKTGRYYTSPDDFTLIYPKFTTNYELDSSILDGMSLTGRFEEALLALPVLRETATPYDTDLYMAYMYGNQAYAHIENMKNPDGLNICFIKDSFAVPFAVFSSLRCNNVYLIDPRYYEDNMEDFINKNDIDYVIIMFSPENLADDFFTFGK